MEESQEKLKRSLKTRHMNMIAIGGALGTGLFLASGASISTAGPGGALAAYGIIGIKVWIYKGEVFDFSQVGQEKQDDSPRGDRGDRGDRSDRPSRPAREAR